MIRIAFLMPHLRPGGAERVVVNWIGALDRSRFSPVLLLGRVEGDFLGLLPPDVLPRLIGGARALTRPWQIARALKEQHIDLAFSATSAMNLALLAAPTRVPRIVSEHTPPGAYLAEAKWPRLRRVANRMLYPRAAAVTMPTEAIAAAWRATPGIGRVEVLPNPVIAASAVSAHARTGAGNRIVSAGRLVPAKGIDTLIEACAILASQSVDFRLSIHGEGPLHGAIAARIEANGLTGHVTLAGHTDPLAPALTAADLFVLASRREGFGNVLVEAMAVGTPVLATRAGGPETFIRDGFNGFLVDADDPLSLAASIAALLADPGRLNAVRQAGLETARAYTVEASTRRFEALVLDLLSQAHT